MASVMDIIVRAQDEASAVLERVGDAGSSAGSLIDDHWVGATAALAGAGAAIEGLARNQQGMTVSTRQLAARMGESEDSVRGWATEITGAGDTLDEMIGLMDLANRRGLEGQESLQTYAGFWDTLGDATGESAVALAEAGVGLAGIGIAAGEESKALDALGFIMDNTSASAGDFLQFVARMGPELREMGIDVNDTAALMGVLETELGLSGRVARTEFRQAVSESDGTLQGMLTTLGVTQEQFETYRASVDGAGAAVERNADITNDAFTPMQRLQTELGNLLYSFGGVAEGAAQFAPLLIAIGPAAKGGQLAMQGFAKIAPMVGGAMHMMLGPIGLVTGAIALLAAAFATDFLGMRSAAEDGVDDMAMNFGEMGDTVHALADRAGGDFQAMKERIQADMEETGRTFEQVTTTIDRELSGIPITADAHFEAYTDVTYQHMQAAKGIVETGVDQMATELGALPQEGADELLANQQALTDATTQLVDFMEAALDPAAERFRLQAFLASGELAAGLADNNPLVQLKAAELRDAAVARLNELKDLTYAAGANGAFAFGNGLKDPAAIAWISKSASRAAAAARGIFPGSEPEDPSSPLAGITTAWGFMDILASGLDHDAEAPAHAMARAMGLVRDEMADGALGLPGGEVAGDDASTAGGGLVVNINAPTVPMTERDIGRELRRQGLGR